MFDTETRSVPAGPDTVEARLWFGWLAMTWRHRGMRWSPVRWLRFEDPYTLWRAVADSVGDRRRAWLMAHNLGFDLRVTDAFRVLPELGWSLRSAVIDDPPTILRWRDGRRTIMAVDSLNYWKMPLAVIGAELGLEKLDMPADDAPMGAWDAYCRRDVEVVLEAMRALMGRVRSWRLGHLAPTIAGQAFVAWRHRHMEAPVLIDADPDALGLARAAYHGGRTEAFRLGPVRGPVEVYDVTSQYPSVMAAEPMPTVLLGTYRSLRVDELAEALSDLGGVADVVIETTAADYPVEHEGRLIFPVGRYRARLAAPELRHALAQGRVVEVHHAALYRQATIFASYVAEWWQRRREAQERGDPNDAMVCKLMLNALYGKFGQKGRVYEAVDQVDPAIARSWIEVDLDTGIVHQYRALGGLWQELVGEVESSESHPAIAATVTAAARMALLALLEDAGRDFVAYVDTDSMFVLPGAPGPSSAVLSRSGLGSLKHERTIDRLIIWGAKDYEADGVPTIKGVRRNATRIDPRTFEQDTFVGLKGAVASGDIGRQLIHRTRKVLARDYRKGVVGSDGVVSPIRLG